MVKGMGALYAGLALGGMVEQLTVDQEYSCNGGLLWHDTANVYTQYYVTVVK